MSYTPKSTISPNSQRPVVLVTGAAKRLGREIALNLAENGWKVAVHYHLSELDAMNTVAELDVKTSKFEVKKTKKESDHAAFQCDLCEEIAVRTLLPRVIAHFGRVDAVVNNAAVFEYDAADAFSYSGLQKHMITNTGAAIVLSEELKAHIFERNKSTTELDKTQGVVVNMLDQKLWNQNPDFLSYTLSKAALEAANTMLAIALAPLVRVVGVAPGLTLTSHLMSDEKFQALHKVSPLGRSSTAQDVALTVRFALENRGITGTTLLVDGGQHLMRFERDFSMMTATNVEQQ